MKVDTDPAPRELDEVLDPVWLTSALSSRFPGVAVEGTTVTETLVTMGTKVRFHVTYDEQAGAPDDLCVKGYFFEPGRSVPSMGRKEAMFYRHLAPGLPVRVPDCLYTGDDPATGHAIIVMNDLVADGCTFLTALNPYSPEEVTGTLDQLARLHAATWDDDALAGRAWMTPSLEMMLAHVTAERMQTFLDDSRGEGLPRHILQADRLRAAVVELVSGRPGGSGCLIHGDAHAGNLFVTAAGEPGIVDWQIIQMGGWALDVAYHVGAVLDVDVRQAHERDLVRFYLDRLASLGVAAPDWDTAWRDVRAAFAYGLYLWGITHRVDRPIIDTFVGRLGSAVAHHGSLDLLGV